MSVIPEHYARLSSELWPASDLIDAAPEPAPKGTHREFGLTMRRGALTLFPLGNRRAAADAMLRWTDADRPADIALRSLAWCAARAGLLRFMTEGRVRDQDRLRPWNRSDLARVSGELDRIRDGGDLVRLRVAPSEPEARREDPFGRRPHPGLREDRMERDDAHADRARGRLPRRYPQTPRRVASTCRVSSTGEHGTDIPSRSRRLSWEGPRSEGTRDQSIAVIEEVAALGDSGTAPIAASSYRASLESRMRTHAPRCFVHGA